MHIMRCKEWDEKNDIHMTRCIEGDAQNYENNRPRNIWIHGYHNMDGTWCMDWDA